MKRPTKKLLLDAAEGFFAEKGYKSTSMEDISSVVGIRPSAIYKHFRNKQDLYEGVIERMVKPFFEMLEESEASSEPSEYLKLIFQYSIDNPNLARFAFHATLRGGEHRKLLVDSWYRPFWEITNKRVKTKGDKSSFFMACNNQMFGHIALAALHAEVLNTDPFSSKSIKDENAVLISISETLL